jgi:hypothetical protein
MSETLTRIFISHSSLDASLVRAIVDLLERSLVILPGQLRCTSVPGYGIPLGAPSPAALRRDLKHCRFVLAVVTQNSLRAPWVLLELGAAWALGHETVLLLAPSVSVNEIKGPLSQLNHGSLVREEDLVQLVGQIAATAGLVCRDTAIWLASIKSVVEAASVSKDDPQHEILRDLRDLHERMGPPGGNFFLAHTIPCIKAAISGNQLARKDAFLTALNRLLADGTIIGREAQEGQIAISLRP